MRTFVYDTLSDPLLMIISSYTFPRITSPEPLPRITSSESLPKITLSVLKLLTIKCWGMR